MSVFSCAEHWSGAVAVYLAQKSGPRSMMSGPTSEEIRRDIG
jgi:hypothetical protein